MSMIPDRLASFAPSLAPRVEGPCPLELAVLRCSENRPCTGFGSEMVLLPPCAEGTVSATHDYREASALFTQPLSLALWYERDLKNPALSLICRHVEHCRGARSVSVATATDISLLTARVLADEPGSILAIEKCLRGIGYERRGTCEPSADLRSATGCLFG